MSRLPVIIRCSATGEFFEFEDTPPDGHCLYHSLCRSRTFREISTLPCRDSGEDLRLHLGRQISEQGLYRHLFFSTLNAYNVWKGSAPTSAADVYAELDAMSYSLQCTNSWGGQQEMLLFSCISQDNVITYAQGTGGDVIKTFDAFATRKLLYEVAKNRRLLPPLPIPSHAESITRVHRLYHHVAGSATTPPSELPNHFAALHPVRFDTLSETFGRYDFYFGGYGTVTLGEARKQPKEAPEGKVLTKASPPVSQAKRAKKPRVEGGVIMAETTLRKLNCPQLVDFLGTHGDDFFVDLVKSPAKAQLLFYANSGYLEYDRYKEYSASHAGKTVNQDSMERAIMNEMLTDEELRTTLETFLTSHSYNEPKLPTCAACGLRQWERGGDPCIQYERIFLNDPLIREHLCYTEEETADFKALQSNLGNGLTVPSDGMGNTRTVEVWKVFSYYEDPTGQYWHLHPEMIETEVTNPTTYCHSSGGIPDNGCTASISTMICPSCSQYLRQRSRRPPLSIAAGIDFGNFTRIGLTEPTFMEQMIIARLRLFWTAIKILPNTRGQCSFNVKGKYKCHAIMFPHDAPECSMYLSNPDLYGEGGLLHTQKLKEILQIYLIDETGQLDPLADSAFDTTLIEARPYVCRQFLLVLHKLNPFYEDINLHTHSTNDADMEQQIGQLNRFLKRSVIRVDDPESVHWETKHGSDVAATHNVEVETETEQQARLRQCRDKGTDGTNGHTDQQMKYSVVISKERKLLSTAESDLDVGAILNFADIKHTIGKTSPSSGPDNNTGQQEGEENTNLSDDDSSCSSLTHHSSEEQNNYAEGMAARETDPLHEYIRGAQIMSTAFPHIFLTGKFYDKQIGRLTQEQMNHLLSQGDARAAQDRRLLGFLYDAKVRLEVVQGVKAHVNGNVNSLEVLGELLEKREHQESLRKAAKDPNSKESKRLFQKYIPHFHFASKNINYGAMEGTTFNWTAHEMAKRFSAATCFLTISPTDFDNPRGLRLSFASSDNKTFPAQFSSDCPFGTDPEDFVARLRSAATLQNQQTGHINLPEGYITKSRRANLAMQNPVAFVKQNKMLLRDILSLLLGLPLEDSGFYNKTEGWASRRTRYFKIKKGILGHGIYAIGVTEDHSKGTLHWHIILLTNLQPYVMQRFAEFPRLCKCISQVLDSFYSSTLTERTHLSNIIRRSLTKHRDTWSVPDSVIESLKPTESLLQYNDLLKELKDGNGEICKSRFHRLSQDIAGPKQSHVHLRTCHEKTKGKTGCRHNMPNALVAETCPVRLVPGDAILASKTTPDTTKRQGLDGDVYHVQRLPGKNVNPDNPPTLHYRCRDILDNQLDKTIVVWETKRPPLDLTLLPYFPETRRIDLNTSDGSGGTASTVSSSDADNFATKANLTRSAILRYFQQGLQGGVAGYRPSNGEGADFWRWLEDADLNIMITLWHEISKKVQKANGFVPTYNPVLSYCTGSHNNTSMLGSLGQAINALHYLIPYSGKRKYPLLQSLTILNKALLHISKYDSQADDHGTLGRQIKHLLARAINQMHLQMEISDRQIAASLLRLPSAFSSTRTVCANVRALQVFHTQMEILSDRTSNAFKAFTEKLSLSRYRAKERLAEVNTLPGDEDMATKPSQPSSTARKEPSQASGQSTTEEHSEDAYLAEDVLQDLGSIKKISLRSSSEGMSDKHILFPAVGLYYYRAMELDDYNFYEYKACIKADNDKVRDETKDKPEDYRQQRHFRMLHAFVGNQDCREVILNKQQTPLLFGRSPAHPGPQPPSHTPLHKPWKVRADMYARYYMTVFYPHRLGDNVYFHWEALQEWVSVLLHDPCAISKFRLMLMDQYMRDLRSSPMCNKMTTLYRERGRHLWSVAERRSYAHGGGDDNNEDNGRQGRKGGESIFDRYNNMAETECDGKSTKTKTSVRALTSMKNQVIHNDLLIRAMEQLGNVAGQDTTGAQQHSHNLHSSSVQKRLLAHNYRAKTLQSKGQDLQDWKPNPAPDGPNQESPGSSERSPHFVPQPVARRAKLAQIGASLQNPGVDNSAQLEIYQLYADHYFYNVPAPNGRSPTARSAPCGGKPETPPPVVLLHGSPGAGKSHVLDAICKAVEVCGKFVFASTFNNINAVALQTRTSSSWLSLNETHIKSTGKFKPQVLKELREAGFDCHSLVLVDEISNQAPWHLNRLNGLCQELTGEYSLPFGGCQTILCGGLTQLGPVRAGYSLTQAVMDVTLESRFWKRENDVKKRLIEGRTAIRPDNKEDQKYMPNDPYMKGVNLILQCRWFELSTQNRSLDAVHTNLVNKNYHGEPITLEDLKHNGYKLLTAEDMLDEDWVRAPILTSTNRERHTLTHLRAIQFAEHFKTVVIRWPTIWDDRNDFTFSPSQLNQIYEDSALYEYFVQGADGFVTDQVQRELGVVNASSFRYHSVKFSSGESTYVSSKMSNALPGQVITVAEPPIVVVVEVTHDTKNAPKTTIAGLSDVCITKRKDPADSNKVSFLIPICRRPGRPQSSKALIPGGRDYDPFRVTLRRVFPLEMASAITAHKSEGQTLKKVIAAFSPSEEKACRLDFKQVHVIMSRFQQQDDFRLFLTGDTTEQKWLTLHYLRNLKPDASIGYFFAGFRPRNDRNPNLNWKRNHWDAERANAYFERVHR